MRLVRSPAAARNISGEAIISQPLRVVLAAPELVVAEPVEVLDEVEIAAELQHRVLADRMMRGEEGAEAQTGHEQVSWVLMMGAAALLPQNVTIPRGGIHRRLCPAFPRLYSGGDLR